MTRAESPAEADGRSGSGPNRRCPGCSAPVDATARFCPNCGVPQPGGERPATELPAGERRRLTILFCDLVGSTALSQQLDPEELGEIVLAYQEMGRSVIANFGGHVAQYLGDGLLAYFGYPTAHEDDAERAVLAGLAILSGLSALGTERSPQVRLEARVGIHVGPAVVGEMGGAGRSDTSAFGSTPNIAARLQTIASPGTVVISDEVCRSLGARFEVVDRGLPELKGVNRPLRVWEVTRVGQRAPRAAARPALAMIGRHRELAIVLDALARADAGQPTHVLVMAEPGVGKTRLLQALYQHVEERDDALWLEGQCSELTAGTPLAPVVQFLRRSLGLDDVHTAREREQKLRAAVAVLGAGADDAAYYLGELLGIAIPSSRITVADEGPEVRRRRTLSTLAALVRELGRERIVIVVVEDLHWSDPTTIELVALLADLEPPARVLCVATSRRQFAPAGRQDDRRVRIELSNLGPVDAEMFARALATEHGLPADAAAQVAQRSDGVPLFIEELVKAAADILGVGTPAVPQTLQALLASRLDLLGDARHVAQAASVLGREFPRPLLAAIAGMADDDLATSLDRLVAAGIVTSQEAATGVVYTFRHALIQDAAYASLLRRNRRALHASAATALTTRFADLVKDSPEIVAHHLVEAERQLEGAGWYETAGRRAAERAALREARGHFENGIRALEPVAPSRERSQRLLSLNVLLANTLMGSTGIGNDILRPVWDRAIALAQEVDDPEEETAALNGLAVYHMNRGELAGTEECVDRTLAIADRVGSRIAGLRGHGTLAQVRLYQARGREAREHVLRAMSLSRPGDFFEVTFGIGHDQETYFHLVSSWASWWLGRPDEALATARQGFAIASRIPSSLSQAMGRHAVAMAHHLRREPSAAAAVARDNLEFTANLDFPYWLGIAEMTLGTQLARLGDPAALKILEGGLARLAESESLSGGSVGMEMLAEAYLHAGRFDDAIGAADAGLASADMLKQPFCNTELLATKGCALVALQRVAEGVDFLEQSLVTGRAQGAASATLQTVLALAPLVDPRRARTLLTDALAAMADGADTPDQLAARAQLAELGPNPQGGS